MTDSKYTVVKRTSASKLGDVTATYYSRCPSSCPLMGSGCYAEGGHTVLAWKRTKEIGVGIKAAAGLLSSALHTLGPGRLWRHGIGGDLPPLSEWRQLVRVSAEAKALGWTYTHSVIDAETYETPGGEDATLWVEALRDSAARGVVVNLSANNLGHLDRLAPLRLPMAVVLPPEPNKRVVHSPGGIPVVTCPVTTGATDSCATCGAGEPLCARPDRDYAIGFPAHGNRTKLAAEVARG